MTTTTCTRDLDRLVGRTGLRTPAEVLHAEDRDNGPEHALSADLRASVNTWRLADGRLLVDAHPTLRR